MKFITNYNTTQIENKKFVFIQDKNGWVASITSFFKRNKITYTKPYKHKNNINPRANLHT